MSTSGIPESSPRIPRVIVLTTVMLTFISFWRAAALVLNDLASTAYYIGGIAEHNVGRAAPYFILLVMIFSTFVRAVYVESCSMFVRGGVYRIVKEAMGSTMAKVAVSALVFDFVLTGPISAVSAGHYIHGFLENISLHFGAHFPVDGNVFSVVLALAVTVYFWRLNIRGIEESSDRAFKIVRLTAVMVIILLSWSIVTIFLRDAKLPPFEIKLSEHSLGWLHGLQWVETSAVIVFFICFGHTLLAMSGEEALAQVYREIEAPKNRNLIKAAIVIFLFSFTFTGLCSMAAAMLVPEAERLAAGDNLLNALVMNLAGNATAKIGMVAFVVAVGGLILAGAVNTSIFASNGVLNRVAEDGVLADWFRAPHRRFGTTWRIINLVAVMQIITILASRGNITLLGEAYAFGVVWSFAFMSLSMLILRFKYKGERAIKVPLNPRIGGVEIPIGLAMVCLLLLIVAVTNLFTKQVATISGILFTSGFFVLFVVSEKLNRRRQTESAAVERKEKFLLERRTELASDQFELPEGRRRVLVPVRDPNNLTHLKAALEEAHERETEVIVLTVKVDPNYRQHAEQVSVDEEEKLIYEGTGILSPEEELLFTRVVELAEKYGETIVPIVVASNNSWYAILRTAHDLQVDEVFLGKSGRISADVQLEQVMMTWLLHKDQTDKDLKFRIVAAQGSELTATF